MTPASPTSLDLARALVALEGAGGKNLRSAASGEASGNGIDQAVRVCEKLQGVLTAFAGAAGFRSLLTRALTLAKAHDPSLAGVQVLEGGSLAGFDTLSIETVTGSTKKAGSAAGGQLLVAQLLDLLVLFIGEPLTLQLVRGAWPDAPPNAIRTLTKDTP